MLLIRERNPLVFQTYSCTRRFGLHCVLRVSKSRNADNDANQILKDVPRSTRTSRPQCKPGRKTNGRGAAGVVHVAAAPSSPSPSNSPLISQNNALQAVSRTSKTFKIPS